MTRAELHSILTDRLVAVEERIRAACRRANRRRQDVTLVAVTKYASDEAAALMPELGVPDLGESRPQELWRKAKVIRGVRWHVIGHLQRNKVARTLPLVHLIHSIDSERLLAEISTEAVQQDRMVDVLFELNLIKDPNKHGFTDSIDPNIVRRYSNVRMNGLMTMAAYSDDPEHSRETFRRLRRERDELTAAFHDVGGHFPHLSMGMTGDFEVGIEEGATLIRVGSALFEGLGPT